MPDYTERIAELTDVRDRALVECENQRRLLGERLVELDEAARPDGAGDLVTRYHAIRDRVEDASTALERMIAIDQRQTEIRDEMKELQKEQDQAFKGLEEVYEQIGSVAFRMFREHPLLDARYSAVFENLARYQDDMRRLDTELDRYSAEPASGAGSLFERLGTRSRRAILRNRRSVRENQLPRLLQDAGRRLMDTDFVERIDDEELNRVAAPVFAARENRNRLDERLTALREESGRLVEEFNDLSRGKKLPRARRDREGEIDTARSELNAVLSQLGAIAGAAPPESLEAAARSLRECEQRTEHFTELIHRLEAGAEARRISGEIDDLEARIAETETRLQELRATRDDRSARRDALLTQRGDEDELFDR